MPFSLLSFGYSPLSFADSKFASVLKRGRVHNLLQENTFDLYENKHGQHKHVIYHGHRSKKRISKSSKFHVEQLSFRFGRLSYATNVAV